MFDKIEVSDLFIPKKMVMTAVLVLVAYFEPAFVGWLSVAVILVKAFSCRFHREMVEYEHAKVGEVNSRIRIKTSYNSSPTAYWFYAMIGALLTSGVAIWMLIPAVGLTFYVYDACFIKGIGDAPSIKEPDAETGSDL